VPSQKQRVDQPTVRPLDRHQHVAGLAEPAQPPGQRGEPSRRSVQPQNASSSSWTLAPSRQDCWPIVQPTGPEKLPAWIPGHGPFYTWA